MRKRTKVKLWAWFRYYFKPKLGHKQYLTRCGICNKIQISWCNHLTCYCKTCRKDGGHEKLKEINYDMYQESQNRIIDEWDKPKIFITLRSW